MDSLLIREEVQEIILPLYSPRNGYVYERSGLNQWNADGRLRDCSEIYIPVPISIHRNFPGFFPYDLLTGQKSIFELVLPNGEVLSASICQENGKALMSNPNADLGEWLLREVLKIPPRILVTNEHLENARIDSIRVIKEDDLRFAIWIAPFGEYREFENII